MARVKVEYKQLGGTLSKKEERTREKSNVSRQGKRGNGLYEKARKGRGPGQGNSDHLQKGMFPKSESREQVWKKKRMTKGEKTSSMDKTRGKTSKRKKKERERRPEKDRRSWGGKKKHSKQKKNSQVTFQSKRRGHLRD